MKAYAASVAGIDTESIVNSATAAKALIKVYNSLSKSGGVAGFFTGSADLTSLGNQLVPFGKGMKAYSKAVSGIDTNSIVNSAAAAKAMIKVANSMPKSGGLSGLFSGSKSLSSLGNQLIPFGKAMKSYGASVSGIDSGSISSSATAAKKLVSLINSMSGIKTGGVNSFKSAIDTLAKTNISGLVKAFNGSASKVASIGSKLTESLAKGFKSKKSSLTSAATAMVNAMQKAITSKASAFGNAGKTLMTKLIAGIKSQKSAVNRAVTSCASGATSGLRGYYDNFYSAGSHVASGFANGISAGTFSAVAKAKAMAESAYKAAKDKLDINSPSKLFRRLGYAVPEGFAQGIDRMGKLVSNSGANMAQTAVDGTRKAIAHVADFINSDVDTQPTIRPVVDLSNVRSGAAAINGMLGDGVSIGVRSNLSAINTMMNQKGQNGNNADVVSAINKLRKDIGNIGGNTYNIDGVTYDDGSNITDAVKSIVRAARIERRV